MRLTLLPLLVAACLPAYDNHYVAPLIVDGGGDGDSGGGLQGSGKFLSGTAVNLEELKTVAGITINIAGYLQPAFTGTTNALGQYQLEIPSAGLGQQGYLILDGSYMGSSILKTLYLPRRLMNGGTQNTGIANHFFKNPTAMGSFAMAVAQALAGHGDIATADSFTDDFAFMGGGLFQYTNNGVRIYRKYTVELSVGAQTLDNSNCKPSMQCCYYYSDGNLSIDFSLTSSNGGFVIVCPSTQTDEVSVKQTASNSVIFEPVLGMHPTGTWPDISLPISTGTGVFIDWTPQ